MTTYTIILDRTDGVWRSIVNTGDYMVLAGHTDDFRLRFGINSDSEGMIVKKGNSVKVEETVFVKPVKRNKGQYTTLYVHKA